MWRLLKLTPLVVFEGELLREVDTRRDASTSATDCGAEDVAVCSCVIGHSDRTDRCRRASHKPSDCTHSYGHQR